MENMKNLVVMMAVALKKEFKAVDVLSIDVTTNIIEFEVDGVKINTLATTNMEAFMAHMVTHFIDKTMTGDNRQSKYKQKLFFEALEEGKIAPKVSSYKKYSVAKLEEVLGY